MTQDRFKQLEKVLRTVIIIGSFLVVTVPLIVVPNSYFPYIIQKTLILRTLIELIFCAYVVLAFFRPEYRPKKSVIFWSVMAYALVMLITTFTSQSLARSWWGNWERMFGTFNYLHYFLWFIVLISVFKEKKYWNRILNFSLLVSVAICLYSLSQRLGLSFTFEPGLQRVNGTIGNASFLASYLLLHIFIALLFISEKKNWKWKICYLTVFLIELSVLMLTATRGAQLALFISLIVFVFLVFLLQVGRQKTIKFLLLGTILLIIMGSLAFVFRNKDFVKENYWLRRLTSYSLSDNTVQTRMRSWRWGIWGFRDNLIFGLGPENYQIAFNRYFEPDFYRYSGDEIWFDRSHNTLIDMASTMGILGLITYLGVFFVPIYYLYLVSKSGYLSKLTFTILFLLLLSYFIQNLAVFDSLNSLIPFYLILAFINFIYVKGQNQTLQNNNELVKKKNLIVSPYLSGPVMGILFFILFFTVNLPEVKANLYVYDAFVAGKLSQYNESVNKYKLTKEIAINPIDPAILLSSSLGEMIARSANIAPREQEIKDLETAISWMNDAIKLDKNNMFLYYLQAKNYSLVAELTRKVQYVEKGIEMALKAKELSPQNVRPYWVLAQLYLFGSKPEVALSYLNEVVKLNDSLSETYLYLSIVYNNMGNTEKTYEQYDKLIDLGYNFNNLGQVQELIAHYEANQDKTRVTHLLRLLTVLEPKDPNNWNNLVDALEEAGKYDEALTTLKQWAEALPASSSLTYQRYQEILDKKNASILLQK